MAERDDTTRADPSEARIRRRDLLRKGAVAGGLIWVTPAIESIASRAAAASGVPSAVYVYGGADGFTGYVKVTVTGPNAYTCTVAVPPTATCETCQQTPTAPSLASCSDVTINVNNYAVSVDLNGTGAEATIAGSFMVCGGVCYHPTGTTGHLVFNCAANGASC